MKYFMICVLSVLTNVIAQPIDTTQSTLSEKVSSFKIQISTPSSSSNPAPIYLLSNGSTTTNTSLAASCTISSSTELFCGSSTVAVGAPLGSPSALFSGVRASEPDVRTTSRDREQLTRSGMGGKMVTTGFKLDAQTSKIGWTNSNFKGGIGFAFKSDESRSIWAVFTKTMIVGSAEAELVAVFD